MTILRLALIADGPSDRALLPILTWSLRSLAPDVLFFEPQFEVRDGELTSELERVSNALRPDMLFVHRDAEREPLDVRRNEIPMTHAGTVRVVPVHMTEAWLLLDEMAIRKAAGNPNGRSPIELPRIRIVENLPDPKAMLRSLLLEAKAASSARKKQRFLQRIQRCVHLVSEYTADFSPLRQLPAFRAFEEDLRQALVR